MLLDIAVPRSFEEPLPPPSWLVGGIVATVIFAAAALLAALPRNEPTPRAEPVLHSGIIEAAPAPAAGLHTPIPFDPFNLSLPVL
jgi:hypothetical protein